MSTLAAIPVWDDVDVERFRAEIAPLGNDRFVESLVSSSYQLSRRLSLSVLAEDICREYAVSVEVMRSASKQRRLTSVRASQVDRVAFPPSTLKHRIS